MSDKNTSMKKEYSSLFRLGLPVLVTELGIIIVSFADTIMVGRYGTSELAAAAFVNNLFLVPFVMLIGFASGLTPLVGALFSKGDNHKAGLTIRTAMRLNTLISILFTILMGILYFFLDRMGQPEDLLPLIRPYYLIMLLGLLPVALFNCFQQASNGVTDTSTPMWIILSANLLNILGNYMLIFGKFGMPELGLSGAGISTIAARIFASIVIIILFMRMKRFRLYKAGLTDRSPSRSIRRKVFFTSLPVMLQSGIECMLWAFGSVVSGWFGAVQLASYQITNTIAQLGFMTYLSFGIAVSIRVSNYCGLNDLAGVRRITRAGLHFCLLLSVVISAVFVVGGETIVGFFTEDPEVIAAAGALLVPLILYQIFDSLQIVLANAIRGTSRVQPLLWASVISYIIVGLPVTLFLGDILGLMNVGVYYSFDIAILAVAVCYVFWYRDTLRRMRLGLRLE